MTEEALTDSDEPATKKGKMGLIIGLILALIAVADHFSLSIRA